MALWAGFQFASKGQSPITKAANNAISNWNPPVRYSRVYLSQNWKAHLGNNDLWLSTTYRDSLWATRSAADYWRDIRNQWITIRQRFRLPSRTNLNTGDSLIFDLGAIDDIDQTYLNGKSIGNMGHLTPTIASAWDQRRSYKIPVNHPAIRWGQLNLITIRIYNQGNVGGLVGLGPVVLVPMPYPGLRFLWPTKAQTLLSEVGRKLNQSIKAYNDGPDTVKGQLVIRRYPIHNPKMSQTSISDFMLPPKATEPLSFKVNTSSHDSYFATLDLVTADRGVAQDSGLIAVVPGPMGNVNAGPINHKLRTYPQLDSLKLWRSVGTNSQSGARAIDTLLTPYQAILNAKFDPMGGLFAEVFGLAKDSIIYGNKKCSINQPAALKDIGYYLLAANHSGLNAKAYDTAITRKVLALIMGLQQPDGYIPDTIFHDREQPSLTERWQPETILGQGILCSGLVSQYRTWGNDDVLLIAKALAGCWMSTFGPTTSQLSIVKDGKNDAIKATSLLLPLAELYQLTGEQQYLTFCRYIIRAMDSPNGPGILGHLLSLEPTAKFVVADPEGFILTVRGLSRCGFLARNTLWSQAALYAYHDLNMFWTLNIGTQAKLGPKASCLFGANTLVQWLTFEQDLYLTMGPTQLDLEVQSPLKLLRQHHQSDWLKLTMSSDTYQPLMHIIAADLATQYFVTGPKDGPPPPDHEPLQW